MMIVHDDLFIDDLLLNPQVTFRFLCSNSPKEDARRFYKFNEIEMFSTIELKNKMLLETMAITCMKQMIMETSCDK